MTIRKPNPADEQSPSLHRHGDGSAITHQHVHNPESLQRIINRLARIEGQVRGIQTMIRNQRACPDVLVQIVSVRAALGRVARIILDEHLSDCLTRAAEEGNIQEELEQLKAALDRFLS
ncbi:metal-sensitive transcriptional regulator [Halomicronema sp. CCY15110]|uniref:metal-sensitive transcriptional regulator n=1 Tax=Halomicronema sp. CCY15110 TaxID=2767773 RepID=UPI001951BDE7|nr:metal-sensitive transcriptional regulator [Halomicronema sp. CCY15110]